ncbi:protein of unknown function DUF853 [Rhizobium phage RHph_X2_30]|nr:protein of unknown function DUF853 [Rhizobium phage RHph_X2_30]
MTAAALSRHAGIPLNMACRHGLITGQTGTGKSVSLMRLAESFSKAGVPVFLADVKTDLAALSRSCPVEFLDVFGATGRPLKSTVSAFGPDLMARALELSDVQAGCLEIAFAAALDRGLPLETLAHLRAALNDIQANREAISAQYGQVSNASVGVILRALLRLEKQGGNRFFGDPQYDVADLLKSVHCLSRDIQTGATTEGTFGRVSILRAERLINSPRVYAAFLLWLLSDLWERLPEVGDIEQPRLVMFFDEAHLLFQDCPSALLRRIEQTVRLIRSKGVGVYFVSQSPDDVPHIIRAQLAHRIAHDRRLPVGVANIVTMTPDGRPWDMGDCRVDLPECPLGALQDEERPPMPAPAETAADGLQWAKLSKPEIVLLLVCLAALAAAGCGLYWLWFAGPLGKAAAILLAFSAGAIIKG